MGLPWVLAPGPGGDGILTWLQEHFQDHLDIRQGIEIATSGIAQISVINGGTGYTSQPTVTITGVNNVGTGATAHANGSGGAVTSVTIDHPGKGYIQGAVVSFSGGGGSGASAIAIVNTRNPPIYPIESLNPNDIQSWLQRHQNWHNDMNSILLLPGDDLTAVNWNDPGERQSWFWINFREHQAAHSKLAI